MIGKFKIFKGLYGDMYSFYGSDDKIINLLGMFLTDDATRDINFFRDWALDLSRIGSGGNMSDLEKENGNVILRYDEVFNDDTQFVTTIKKFVNILDTWEKLNQEKPQEILLTRDGNEIALLGVS